MNRPFVFYVLMSLMPLFLVCEKETVSIKPANVTLRAEYVGVTEAWLKLQTHGAKTGVKIKRGNKTIFRTAEINKDTVVYDSTLLPAHTYNYALFLQDGRGDWHKAQEEQITTMDTTSHNFQWEVVEFPSPYGSGALYDVAIINENDIWAVGEIYSDSTHDWLPYNAVHWDGSKWELKKIPYYDETGYAWYTPIHSILAFSENDIWFEAGIHWNGEKYISKKININFPSHVNKMWGTSSNDFYIIGNNGLIAHYDGRSWQRIESGTETTIQDIWGIPDPYTGEWLILCAASPGYGISNAGIIRIKPDQTVEKFTWVSGRAVRSVWFESSYNIFTCGSGIFRKRKSTKDGWEEIGGINVIPAQTERIRGTKINDVFVVGHFGYIAHFNGNDFSVIRPNGRILYMSCDYKNNLMVAVGEDGRNAYLLRVLR